MNKLMEINGKDNVLVVTEIILPGETGQIGEQTIIFEKEIGFGHKVAARDISAGEKIIKFGIPIGSATEDIRVGAHIHLHNLKSDYLATYTLDHEYIKSG